MAKVKIQGHASGTGVITVTAPNTSTDRTITLPDSTGELLSTAGGTMTGELVLPVEGLDMPVANTYITGGGHNVVQVDATMSYFYGGTGGVQFRTADNTSELVGIDNSGHIVAGNGVTLGNGQTYAAANTLDDYEEGTWNPSFGADNQGFTIGSTSASVGKYVKIGSLVHFQMYITIQNSTPTSQGFRIGGLPYANNSSAFAFFPIGGTYSGTNANAIHDKAQWRLDKNGTTFRFYIASENANKDGNQAWGGSNTEYAFHVSGTYMITI